MMNIDQINKAMQGALDRLLSLEGNSDVRDDLLRAKASMELLRNYAANGKIKNILDLVSKLVEVESTDSEFMCDICTRDVAILYTGDDDFCRCAECHGHYMRSINNPPASTIVQ